MHLPDKELLRPDEAAAYLSVHKRTVLRWVEEKRLEAVQPTKRTIRITRTSVLKIKPTPDYC